MLTLLLLAGCTANDPGSERDPANSAAGTPDVSAPVTDRLTFFDCPHINGNYCLAIDVNGDIRWFINDKSLNGSVMLAHLSMGRLHLLILSESSAPKGTESTLFSSRPIFLRFDEGAGSRTVYQYLKLLVEMGYSVKLIPDNFFHDTVYSTVYEQLGIEILYGLYYADNWKR